MDYKPKWHWDGIQLQELLDLVDQVSLMDAKVISDMMKPGVLMVTDEEWNNLVNGGRSVIGSTTPCEGVSEGSNPSDHPNLLSAESNPQADGRTDMMWSAVQDGVVITSSMSDQEVYTRCVMFGSDPLAKALENFLDLLMIRSWDNDPENNS